MFVTATGGAPYRRPHHSPLTTHRSPLHHSPQRSGVAAAELAILLPFLALMFFVAVDYCRVFHVAGRVAGRPPAGALSAAGAAPSTTPTTATDAARSAAVAEASGLDPALRPSDVAVTIGTDSATVTVSYQFLMMTSYTGAS